MYGIRISQQCKIGTYYDFQIEFGVIDGYRAAIKQFHRSVNRDQISFTCGGWCSLCGPISRPIKFQRSMEFSEFKTVLFVFSKKKKNIALHILIALATFFQFQLLKHKLLFVRSEIQFYKEIGIVLHTNKINNILIENRFNNNCLNFFTFLNKGCGRYQTSAFDI